MPQTLAAPPKAVPDTHEALLRHWRFRNSHPDVVRRWHEAAPDRKGALAFVAVAQDPGVLDTIPRTKAGKLAEEAARYASNLRAARRMGDATQLAASLVAAELVLGAVDAWRTRQRELDSLDRRDGEFARILGGDADDGLTTAERWNKARLECPEFSEATGRMCLGVAASLPPGALGALGDPWTQVIGLGALRYAARHRRCALLTTTAAASAIETAMVNVQAWTLAAGSDPFDVPLGEDPVQAAALAAALSRDAGTCGRLAARVVPGGKQSPGWGVWEASEQRSACAALALDPGILRRPCLDEGARKYLAQAVQRASRNPARPPLPERAAADPATIYAEADRWLLELEADLPILPQPRWRG